MNLYFFKNILKEIIFFISFVVSIFNLIIIIFKYDFKSKKIFLQPEGGFAHTILSSEVLKRLYNANDWIIIFGYNPIRHNYLVQNLYGKNFVWLKLALNFRYLNLINEKYTKIIFNFLKKYLEFRKIDHNFYVDFIDNYENFDQKKINKKFNKDNLLMHEYNAYKIFNNKKILLGYKNFQIHKKFNINLGFKKKCGFAFKKKAKDFFTNERSSDDIDKYRKSFISIVEYGYEIFLYGDKIKQIPEWFKDLGDNIYYHQKSNIGKNEYNLMCGLICDCFIGPASGASSWKYIFHKKPQLILDSYPIGWGFYNSIISFKIIENFPKLVSVDEILDNKIYHLEKPPFQTRYTSVDEKNLIISNFIENLDKPEKDVVNPDDLKLSKDHPLLWSNSLISKTWYDLQKNNLYSR